MTTPAEFTPIPASAADYAPRAWVGCLGCYNEGRLTGDWVDALDASEFVPCKRVDHEEWWVFDHEGFDGFLTGECAPMDAQDLAENLAALDPDIDLRALRAWLSMEGIPLGEFSDHVGDFRESFVGIHKSLEDYVWELMDEELDALPKWVSREAVVNAYAHDLTCRGDFWTEHLGWEEEAIFQSL